MKKHVKIYSSLFDIGRDRVDARAISDYIIWLKQTIKIFPEMTIFHNGTLKNLDLPAELIEIDIFDLKFFSLMPRVIKVINSMTKKADKDITFLLPAYSLVQLAKFELAYVLNEPKIESFLWVDAGISRFISGEQVDIDNISGSSRALIESGFDGCFEIDLKRNFRPLNFSIKSAAFGSCKRIISGTSFWINGSSVENLYEDLFNYSQQILSDNQWDNEQVILRNFIPKFDYIFNFQLQNSSQPGTVVRKMSKDKFGSQSLLSSILQSRM